MYAIRPWLYVGKFRETQDEQLLQRQGIGAMLQLKAFCSLGVDYIMVS